MDICRFLCSYFKHLDQNLLLLGLWVFLLRGWFWGIWQLLWWQQVDLPVGGSVTAGECLLPVYLMTLALMLRPLICTVNVCVSSGGHQEELCSSGVTILNQDFTVALETLQDVQATAVGAPKVI